MSAPREFPNAVQAWKYLKKKSAEVQAQQPLQEMLDNSQQIGSGNTRDVIIPVPLEGMAQLERNGIWKHVLENLTYLSDITSAYLAGNVFKRHLERKRMMALLPQVFAVLRENEYLYYVDPEHEFFEGDEATNKTVLNQRLVSKEWKKAAEEQFLEPIGFFHPDWYLTRCEMTNDMVVNGPILCKFRDVEDVDFALNALPSSESCSSLLRIVEVDDELCNNLEIFYTKLGQFLDIHGMSVWALRFHERNYQGQLIYKDFWNLVSRMPNLKELFVSCDVHKHFCGAEEARLLQRFPFPSLASLKRLAISEVSTNQLWTTGILKGNPGLKAVTIYWGHPRHLSVLLPALGKLNLECFEFGVAEQDSIALEHVQQLGHLGWRLKVLRLIRACLNDIQPMLNASDIFEILNQFNDTLEEVNLDSMKLRDDDKRVVVHFPNLKMIDKVSIEI